MQALRILAVLVVFVQLIGCVSTIEKKKVDVDAQLDTYIQLGLNYLGEGKKDQARFNLLKAVDLDNDSPEAHNALALLYQSEGENERAKTHFEEALSADPSSSQVRNNYARFLLASGDAEGAEREYEKVTEDVDYRLRAQAFYGLGIARKNLDKYEEAKDAFVRAYQRDGRLSVALLELADISVIQEDFIVAKEMLDSFEAQSEPTPRSLKLGYDLAAVYGDENAKASYGMSLRNLYPDSREAREHILSTQGNR